MQCRATVALSRSIFLRIGALATARGTAAQAPARGRSIVAGAGALWLASAMLAPASAQEPPPPSPDNDSGIIAAAGGVTGGQPPTLIDATATPTVSVTGASNPALSSSGVTEGVGNAIVVINGGITATNLNGTGLGVVNAQAGGTIDLGTGTNVQAMGSGSATGIIGATALYAADLGSGGQVPTITASDLTVSTTSDKPYGIYANRNGLIVLSGLTTVSTSGNGASGWGLVTNNGGVVTAQDALITMGGIGGVFGDQQQPISAYAGGVTNVTGTATVDVTGNTLNLLVASGSPSAVNVNNITGTGTSVIDFATIAVAANGGIVNVPGNAQLAVNAATTGSGLETSGGGTINFTGTSALSVTGGVDAFGLLTVDGGTINLNNSTLTVSAPAAAAVLSEAGAADTLSTINVANSTLASSGDGIVVRGGTTNVNFTGVTLTNGSGLAIDVGSNAGVPGTLNFIADSSMLTGFAITAPDSASNVTLQNGTLWTMTGSSSLTNLAVNSSRINFTPPTGDPTQLASYKTLTVGNYLASNAVLGINTFLAADGAPSDRLVANGVANGDTRLSITNAGGLGDLTTGNGILNVVDFGPQARVLATFTLANPVVAGPYEYMLFRGTADGNNPNAWFLRSTFDCALAGAPAQLCPTPPPDGAPPPDVGVPPGSTPGVQIPHYRQEVSLYAALPALTLQYGRALLDTLHERVGGDVNLRDGTAPIAAASGTSVATGYAGGPGLDMGPIADLGPDPAAFINGAWGRVIAQHGEQDGDRLGIYGSGPKYDYDITAIQAGVDVLRWRDADGTRTHAGLYGALGDLNSDVTHFDGVRAGRDSFSAYTIGGYWTYFGNPGWYLDGIVQGTWYDTRAQSTRLPALETDGWGFGASLEGGYPVRLGAWLGGLVAEPQLQLVYQTVDLGTAREIAATVRFDDVESLAGRVGVRFATNWLVPGPGGGLTPATVWVRPSVWQDFLGDPKTLFSSETGFIPFRADLGEAWVDINAGIALQVGRSTALFASGSYDVGVEGRSEAWDGKIGLRFRW
jgi:outer membrane autotransporter protein